MGAAQLARPGPVRALFDRVSNALALDVADVVRRGLPPLKRTEVSQPALVALCLGLAEELSERARVDAVAGHSVGELCAFSVAGCLSSEMAVDAAIERGRLMAEAARRSPGGMLALRSQTDAAAACALAPVQLAAENAPEEWVVTGERDALRAVAARFPSVRLPVSGPWHSAAMAAAEEAWRAWLARVTWRPPRLLLVANATGAPVTHEDPVTLLAGQLTRPVRWARCLETLRAAGIERWRILGPGRTLRGLCRANLGLGVEVSLEDEVPATQAVAS
jgi:[acyl-carrier-protein] S-malonyltransferase